MGAVLSNPALRSRRRLVRTAGVEPAQPFRPRDFKSLASTGFATSAIERACFILRGENEPQPPLSLAIGGWKASPMSHGKKIQVSCDTSVRKVLTSGRPNGLA